jgi:hypothetical protein
MADRYFHGGVPNLRRGMMILAPCITRAPSLASFGAAGICLLDRVYVTTDPLAAKMYACMHQSMKGEVYEVEPIGAIEADPDCNERGLSWQCEKARIMRVIAFSKADRIAMRNAFLRMAA